MYFEVLLSTIRLLNRRIWGFICSSQLVADAHCSAYLSVIRTYFCIHSNYPENVDACPMMMIRHQGRGEFERQSTAKLR